MPQRRVAIYGAGGQIGSALATHLQTQGVSVFALNWKSGVASLKQSKCYEEAKQIPFDVVIASGITDPSVDEKMIYEANRMFPEKVWECVRGLPVRMLTIGTIQERFESACEKNPYLRSKLELGRWVQKQWQSEAKERLLHLRLHTVYSDHLKPHMFLGQMANAIRRDQTFEMSAGTQLREYHHASDVAVAIGNLLQRQWQTLGPLFELSSGQPIKLADLAQLVFDRLGKTSLLKIGALKAPPGENLDQAFSPTDPSLFRSRDALEGVIAAIKRHL